MIRIKILLKNVRIIFKKRKSVSGPFSFFFYNKLKHPHVKCSLLFLIVLVTSKLSPTKLLSYPKVMWQVTNTTLYWSYFNYISVLKKIISIQIGFYENTSQRPILKEIGLILKNKIREWINIRSTISRYLQSVEHQLTWKKENNNCSVKCC